MASINRLPDGAIERIARTLAESFTHAQLYELFAQAGIDNDGAGSRDAQEHEAAVRDRGR